MQTSIKKRIIDKFLRVISIMLLVMGIIMVITNSISTNRLMKTMMTTTSSVASERVQWEISYLEALVTELGCEAKLSDDTLSDDEKMDIINNRVEANGLVRGNYIHLDGNAYNGNNYSDREYFKEALKGNTSISEPLISRTTGDLSIIVAAPVWKDGVVGSEVVSVIYIVPTETFLNDIVQSLNMSKHTESFMLDSTGNIIANKNIDYVKEQKNIIKESEKKASLKKLAGIHKKIIKGKSGYTTYREGLTSKVITYAPIKGTKGWTVAISAPKSDYTNATVISIGIMLICLAVSIIIARKLGNKLGDDIGVPIKKCAERLRLLSQGDLQTPVPVVAIKDETYTLAEAMESMVHSFDTMIGDMKYMLAQMEKGEFTSISQAEESYVGEFYALYTSIMQINTSLSNTMEKIQGSSNQVATGAGQLADAAQSLAIQTTEQANAVDSLTNSIVTIGEQISMDASEARKTSDYARQVGGAAKESTGQMSAMKTAMKKISEASMEIRNIIQEIENIASSTDLLALNASIEAARAGEAGKGFAVVASEIGNLAKQCAVAVEDTRGMIVTALNEVENGSQIVNQTITDFQSIIDGISEVIAKIENVADSSEKEKEEVLQLNGTIDKISEVVQDNSAIAEETSATGDELSNSADTLNQLVAQFQLVQK